MLSSELQRDRRTPKKASVRLVAAKSFTSLGRTVFPMVFASGGASS